MKFINELQLKQKLTEQEEFDIEYQDADEVQLHADMGTIHYENIPVDIREKIMKGIPF